MKYLLILAILLVIPISGQNTQLGIELGKSQYFMLNEAYLYRDSPSGIGERFGLLIGDFTGNTDDLGLPIYENFVNVSVGGKFSVTPERNNVGIIDLSVEFEEDSIDTSIDATDLGELIATVDWGYHLEVLQESFAGLNDSPGVTFEIVNGSDEFGYIFTQSVSIANSDTTLDVHAHLEALYDRSTGVATQLFVEIVQDSKNLVTNQRVYVYEITNVTATSPPPITERVKISGFEGGYIALLALSAILNKYKYPRLN